MSEDVYAASYIRLQLFYEAAPSFVRLDVEHLPLMMDIGIRLQLRSRLSAADTVFIAPGEEMLHYDSV